MRTTNIVSGLVWLAGIFLMSGVQANAQDYSFSRAWQDVQKISDVLAAERANVERSELKHEATESLNLPQVEFSGA